MPNHPYHLRPHKKWLLLAKNRERQSAAPTNNHVNTSSHKLSPLEAGGNILIHDPPSVGDTSDGLKLVELLRYYPTGNIAFG